APAVQRMSSGLPSGRERRISSGREKRSAVPPNERTMYAVTPVTMQMLSIAHRLSPGMARIPSRQASGPRSAMVRGYHPPSVINRGFASLLFCHGHGGIVQTAGDPLPVHREPVSHDFYVYTG